MMEPTADGRGDTSKSELQRLESAVEPSPHSLRSTQQHNFTPNPMLPPGSPRSSTSRGQKRTKQDASPETPTSDNDEGEASASLSAPLSVDPWIRDMLIRIDHNVLGNRDNIADLETEISILKDQADSDRQLISNLEGQIEFLTVSNNVLGSRMIAMEKRMDRYDSEQVDQKNRSMRDNIIIRSKGDDYKETTNEDTAEKVKKFINKELRVAVKESQDIQIHRAHRMGKAVGGKNSMMIAKIPHESDKKKIFSNVKALKDTSFSISVQCAPQTEERKMLAWAAYKAARKDKKESRFDHTGRLHIEGVPQAKYDPIKLPPSSNLLEGKHAKTPLCGRSTIQTVQGHQFVAYAAHVTSLQEISDYRDFLHSSGVFKEADFAPHAFSLSDGQKYENFNSDGDHFSGLQILKAIRDKKEKDVCVFVAHLAEPNSLVAKLKNAALDKVTAEALLSLKKAME